MPRRNVTALLLLLVAVGVVLHRTDLRDVAVKVVQKLLYDVTILVEGDRIKRTALVLHPLSCLVRQVSHLDMRIRNAASQVTPAPMISVSHKPSPRLEDSGANKLRTT